MSNEGVNGGQDPLGRGQNPYKPQKESCTLGNNSLEIVHMRRLTKHKIGMQEIIHMKQHIIHRIRMQDKQEKEHFKGQKIQI
ncbi:MAG: hypothetical protein EZS28_043771 [Streblomastix strix]|uniref:Uncharacterized protein n=1 Tax=Streblomastix strix TaxID=222440 RepID=A0A5J4TS40_9EUKA|nr:MAG: hypothetical protein EZS28_043771 [Streblomastix strix]